MPEDAGAGAPPGEGRGRSEALRGAQVLLVASAVLGSLAGFVLMAVALGATVLQRGAAGLGGQGPGELVGLVWVAVLGAGSYCSVVAALHVRALRLGRAFRWALAASLLPPVEVLALAAALMVHFSPEAQAARARRSEPQPAAPAARP